MSDQNETELIRDIVAGSQQRFEIWLLDHYEKLHAHIERKLPGWLRESIGAEDLLQETLISAFRGVHQFRGDTEKSLFIWLRKIAENKLLDAIRANTRLKRGGNHRNVRACDLERSNSIVQLVELLSDGERSPSSRIAAKEAAYAMEVGIASLPENQRIAITLRYLNGMSIAETAVEMKKSPEAIRGLLQRGRSQLNDTLDRSSKWFSR